MSILVKPGKYIIAVSGGIDSVVLLHMLHQQPDIELIVAHFDHGIRKDSSEDADFVRALSSVYGLSFECGSAKLGKEASEETARIHRYIFLNQQLTKHRADAIITAHHQDDVIETAALNLQRGTHRRGLVSLQSNRKVIRPLLSFSKAKIKQFALLNHLEWREDSTNNDKKYARNRVRARLHKSLDAARRSEIISLLGDIQQFNYQIEMLVNEILINTRHHFPRSLVFEADPSTAELIAGWLRISGAEFNKNTISRIIDGALQLRNGSKIDVDKQYYCLLTKEAIVLKQR